MNFSELLLSVRDIDETLIVFNSLLLGSWAVAYGKDSAAMNLLGERWEAAILNVADKHFFYTQVGAALGLRTSAASPM